MGSQTNSMFWMFGSVIVIYIVGMSIYTLVEKIKNRRKWK